MVLERAVKRLAGLSSFSSYKTRDERVRSIAFWICFFLDCWYIGAAMNGKIGRRGEFFVEDGLNDWLASTVDKYD